MDPISNLFQPLSLLASSGGHDLLFEQKATSFLGLYYFILALANVTAGLLFARKMKIVEGANQATAAALDPHGHVHGHGHGPAVPPWKNPVMVWGTVGMVYLVMAAFSWSGRLFGFPVGFQQIVNDMTGPVVYTVGTTLLLLFLFVFRDFFVKPIVAWSLLNLSLLAMGLSMNNESFWQIVAKPDNVPIVALLFLLGFFTWLGAARAVANDKRAEQGLPPLEKELNEKVLVWPDLVYTELICMIVLTVVLLVWAIVLKAPLEEPASSAKTPNPSKAPWYFLGLQEMLVYFDPWMAGVVLPSLIIVGLMAIPYLDFNKQGNGYYTINQRKFAYIIFQLGFLELWITLIVLGTFLRGPNWNFFGPFEPWDAHKSLALNNVYLGDWVWINIFGQAPPRSTGDMGIWQMLWIILQREFVGILLLIGYFVLLPPVLAVTVFRKMFVRMGFIRYMVMVNLLLFMAVLPIKMVLRWVFDLKYIVQIPEFFLNF